jgi:hypothetical protein
MSNSESPANNFAIVWGTFILFLGVVLLLQATGVLDWALWGTLWKFWPVLIIILGLALLLPQRRGWLMALVSIAIFGICLWVSILQYGPNLSGDRNVVEQRFTYPLTKIERANATIDLSAGTISITKLKSNNQLLVEILDEHDGRPQEHLDTMNVNFTTGNGTVNINVAPVNQNLWHGFPITWLFNFNQGVPIDLDIKCDASKLNLSLQGLDVKTLDLAMNASSGTLTLPDSAGSTFIRLDLNVSNLEITVPNYVAVKINIDNNLSVVAIDKERFPRQGEYYISPDYESAANGIELNITCDVSRLVIR